MGGGGFIAYYIVLSLLVANDLLHNGNMVVILVRDASKAAAKYGTLLEREDLQMIVQDICMPINEENKHFDYVIHAASAADARYFDSVPVEVFNSNVIGTENVIHLVEQQKCVAAVYVSSFTVYGSDTNLVKKIDEDYCGIERWDSNRACYSYGKRSAEFICMAAARKCGTPIRIVRPGFVYGASSKDDNRVYAEIIRAVADEQPIILRSTGYIYRSMIYVTDLVRGIFCVLLNGENGEAYNVANEHISIREFAQCAVKVSESNGLLLRFTNREDKDANPPAQIMGEMDCSKLRICGWHPRISVDEGIRMAATIYRSFDE